MIITQKIGASSNLHLDCRICVRPTVIKVEAHSLIFHKFDVTLNKSEMQGMNFVRFLSQAILSFSSGWVPLYCSVNADCDSIK